MRGEKKEKSEVEYESALGFGGKKMAEAGQRTIGKYTLGDTLGKGGYGKVKLGTDMETGEQVALKFLK